MSRSDMLVAIYDSNLDELRKLVSMQKFSDTTDLRNTLLHEAVKGNKKAITEFLLQDGSNPNSIVYWTTPLNIAAGNGSLGIIEILLNHGADINAKDPEGASPLMYAIQCEEDDAAQLLLERGARLFSDNEGRSPLHVAVTRNSLKLTKMLLQNGAPVNAVITSGSEKGYTALHSACSSSRINIDIIESLLSNEADVNLKTEGGLTPLHIVSQFGKVRISNLLRIADNYVPFFKAVKLAKVLLTAGADINAATPTEKLTPLHFACKNSNSDFSKRLVKVFLNHNADVNLKDKNGDTAIQICVNKDEELTKLLLEHKANVNSQDIDGCTALHSIFGKMGSDIIVELLLKFGADINIKDRDNRTPMHDALLMLREVICDKAILDIMRHAFALDAINLYDINDLKLSLFLSKLHSTDKFDMESHLKNCNQEVEKLKFVNVPGYQLTCYALMTRSIHSLAGYVKTEDLITHFASDDFTTEFPIYAPIIEGRLRNAFQRRPLIGDANEFFRHHFQLPYVCVDHILSCLSSDDLQNLKDAM